MAEKITSLKAELKETTKTDRNDDEVSTGMGI
jgi:hypothetical protein